MELPHSELGNGIEWWFCIMKGKTRRFWRGFFTGVPLEISMFLDVGRYGHMKIMGALCSHPRGNGLENKCRSIINTHGDL